MLLWWICRTVSFRAGLGPVFGRVFRQKGARALPFVRAFPAPDNVPVNLPFFVSVWFGPAKFAMFLSGMGGNAWKQLQQQNVHVSSTFAWGAGDCLGSLGRPHKLPNAMDLPGSVGNRKLAGITQTSPGDKETYCTSIPR